MKLGIKKIHENEWQLHIESAFVHLDRYSLALLYANLEHLLDLEHGQEGSILTGLIKLAKKILELSDAHLQLLLRDIDNQDLLKLILVVGDSEIKNKVLNNIGSIISKQLVTDIETSNPPSEDDAARAIKHIIEKMFELETSGKISFIESNQKFI
jgi:flagellar motor switch protein FliG